MDWAVLCPLSDNVTIDMLSKTSHVSTIANVPNDRTEISKALLGNVQGRNPRVVAIGPMPPPVSGTSVAFNEVCIHLARRGIDLRIIDISPKRHTAVGLGRFASRLGGWLRALPALAKSFRGSTIPTAYLLLGQARWSLVRDLCCVFIAKHSGARIVAHVHGGSYHLLYENAGPLLRWSIRTMLQRIDRIIVLGNGLRSMFAFCPGLESRIVVVPNGLPADGWIADRPRTLDRSKPIRVLFLSNLLRTKGYDELLDAVALLRREGHDLHLELAGEWLKDLDDPTAQSAQDAELAFRRRVTDLGLESVVNVHGTVSGHAKRALLEQCSIFVLPTRYRFEGQPIAIIEALAAGLPVVATRYRAIPDLVEDGVSGALIEDSAPMSIAEGIRRVLRPGAYRRMSDAAIATVRSRFTSAEFLRKMEEHLVRVPANNESI